MAEMQAQRFLSTGHSSPDSLDSLSPLARGLANKADMYLFSFLALSLVPRTEACISELLGLYSR